MNLLSFLSIKQFIIICVICLVFLFIITKAKGIQGSWSKYESLDLSAAQLIVSKKVNKKLQKESKGEKICRDFLENYFGMKFLKSRPIFLKNPITKNYNLELDCYSNEYKLAVEYNGKQHYKYVPYFHKNFEAFRNQQYRDELKKRLCVENNVILIEVPYTIKFESIPEFLAEKLKNHGFIKRKLNK